MAKEEPLIWHAMRATYRREMQVKNLLDEQKIENFLPMRYDIQLVRGKKVRVYTPAIHNLIFVRATQTTLKEFKARIPHLQYIMQTMGARKEIITIPEQQMQQFIAVTSTCDNKLIYLKPEEVDLNKGAKVRIHGGAFNGVEGTFLKVKGARSRRVVVLIQGITAVATAEIASDLIEVLS